MRIARLQKLALAGVLLALGSRSDLRHSHEAVIEDGPLPVLRRKVKRWIERERGR